MYICEEIEKRALRGTHIRSERWSIEILAATRKEEALENHKLDKYVTFMISKNLEEEDCGDGEQ